MSTRSYKKATIEEVMSLYHQGYNFSQTARELGCCKNTVTRRVREYINKTSTRIYISSKPYKGGFSPLTLCDMYHDGMSVAEIAITSGFSKSYIYKVLKDYTDASR